MSGWEQITFAFRCFISILFDGTIPDDIAPKVCKSQVPDAESSAAKPHAVPVQQSSPDTYDGAVQILALLQRDGRLIDFLAEDVSAYPDAQLGAAVRSIHDSCRKVLDSYVKLEPIFDSEEDQSVTVQSEFDPAAIKLIGNVTARLPLRGLLRHKGWQAKEVHLPQLSPESGRRIVAPAEIEIP